MSPRWKKKFHMFTVTELNVKVIRKNLHIHWCHGSSNQIIKRITVKLISPNQMISIIGNFLDNPAFMEIYTCYIKRTVIHPHLVELLIKNLFKAVLLKLGKVKFKFEYANYFAFICIQRLTEKKHFNSCTKTEHKHGTKSTDTRWRYQTLNGHIQPPTTRNISMVFGRWTSLWLNIRYSYSKWSKWEEIRKVHVQSCCDHRVFDRCPCSFPFWRLEGDWGSFVFI